MQTFFFALLIVISTTISPLALAMPIPPETKAVVTFIFVPGKDGKPIANGTGFFVGVKNKATLDTYSVYLITAKHVLQKEDSKTFFPFVFIRINKKNSGAEMLRLDLVTEGIRRNVFFHNDSSVDIAIVPALPDQQKYDFKFLPDDFLTTKDEFKKLNIREGSDVFFTGLFTPQFTQEVADQRNYPIVRFGKVALVADEKINWGKLKDPMELYLIESASYGGNSGSPVYFYLGAEREPGMIVVGNPILKLAGVMLGTFTEANPITFIETATLPASKSSIGIAFVVPAYKLYEILFSDELKKYRNF
jgi:hypothetical protein